MPPGLYLKALICSQAVPWVSLHSSLVGFCGLQLGIAARDYTRSTGIFLPLLGITTSTGHQSFSPTPLPFPSFLSTIPPTGSSLRLWNFPAAGFVLPPKRLWLHLLSWRIVKWRGFPRSVECEIKSGWGVGNNRDWSLILRYLCVLRTVLFLIYLGFKTFTVK